MPGGGEAINVSLRIRIRIRSLGVNNIRPDWWWRVVVVPLHSATLSLSLSLCFSCCTRLRVSGFYCIDFLPRERHKEFKKA